MTYEDVTVLLTGAAGLLGTWLRRTAPGAFNVIPATHRRRVSATDVVADLRDRGAVASALTTVKPGLVIHAGYARDHASIVDATRNLADMAQEVNADLIFVSSEAVFSGDGAPRSEAARPDPVWDYGRWKAEAEEVVSNRDPNAVIVRLPLIISVDPEDHILAGIRFGHEKNAPTVWYSDEMRQPAYAEELCRAIWHIASVPREKRAGVWHLPGPERLSRYEIADRAVAALGLDRSSIVSAITPVEAHRPRDLNLIGERATAQIGWCPTPIHTSTTASTRERSAAEESERSRCGSTEDRRFDRRFRVAIRHHALVAGQQSGAFEVLGIRVSPRLAQHWRGWLAPEVQPFFVERTSARGVRTFPRDLTPELRDTYRTWALDRRRLGVVWLSEGDFSALPRSERARLVRTQAAIGRGAVPTVRAWADLLESSDLRAQADGHRFVWWPSLLTRDPRGILGRQISTNRLPSRHQEVAESTWRKCQELLPGARGLAGTFPTGSNACCFSTVLDASGADSKGACDSVEPFVSWLSVACNRGGDASHPGTVLVWRDPDGKPVHAAVSIGDDWGLEKPSQEWHSPQAIAAIKDIVRTSRLAGQRMERYTIKS